MGSSAAQQACDSVLRGETLGKRVQRTGFFVDRLD